MGYYTHYKLKTLNGNSSLDDEIGNYIKEYKICYGIEGFPHYNNDSCKWYHYDEDMKLLSTIYPQVIFQLRGEGEEPGDLWVAYYKDGKGYRAEARIIYEEYDEKRLL